MLQPLYFNPTRGSKLLAAVDVVMVLVVMMLAVGSSKAAQTVPPGEGRADAFTGFNGFKGAFLPVFDFPSARAAWQGCQREFFDGA